jgi:hypothetical protein
MTSIAILRSCSLGRTYFSAKLEACGEGQQGDVARLLDGQREAALVTGADTSQATGNDLATLGDEALKQANVAVGDGVDLLGAELADLLAAEELASSGSAAGSTRRTRSAGWAARAGVRARGSRAGGVSLRSCLLLGALFVSSAMMFPFQVRWAFDPLQARWGASE